MPALRGSKSLPPCRLLSLVVRLLRVANPTSQPNGGEINPLELALTIAFPVSVIFAIVGYRKYRATVLRRRIKHLNRIWQIASLKKRS